MKQMICGLILLTMFICTAVIYADAHESTGELHQRVVSVFVPDEITDDKEARVREDVFSALASLRCLKPEISLKEYVVALREKGINARWNLSCSAFNSKPPEIMLTLLFSPYLSIILVSEPIFDVTEEIMMNYMMQIEDDNDLPDIFIDSAYILAFNPDISSDEICLSVMIDIHGTNENPLDVFTLAFDETIPQF